jgi:four helix bundle protein
MKGEAPSDVRERTLECALRSVRVYHALHELRDGAAEVIGKQFLRAATSVGAAVADAQAAGSRADFVHKYSIAQKEARESLYWLELLRRGQVTKAARLDLLINETNELVSIITAIILNAKKRGEWRQ